MKYFSGCRRLVRGGAILMVPGVLLAVGCVSSSVGPKLPLRPVNTPPPALTYDVESDILATYGSPWRISSAQLARTLESDLRKSGYFKKVREARFGRALHFNAELVFRSSPWTGQVGSYSFLTVGLIPMWLTHDLVMKTEVFARGHFVKAYTERIPCREIRWLPLLPLSPFMRAKPALRSAGTKLTHRLLHAVREDGWLDPNRWPETVRSVPPVRGNAEQRRELNRPVQR